MAVLSAIGFAILTILVVTLIAEMVLSNSAKIWAALIGGGIEAEPRRHVSHSVARRQAHRYVGRRRRPADHAS